MNIEEVREEIIKVLMQEDTEDIIPPHRSYPGLPKGIALIKALRILDIPIGGEVFDGYVISENGNWKKRKVSQRTIRHAILEAHNEA